jgi:hypothetical protein
MDMQRAEARRDQGESAFTPILRRLFEQVPALLGATFVDAEGECIDYVSAMEPYEAKVAAAHMHMLMSLVRDAPRTTARAGESFALEVATPEREVWVRCIGDDYLLVAIMLPDFVRAQLRDALITASTEFRAEVGIQTPRWEMIHQRLSVRVRAATGWQYAPATYSAGGVRVAIADVLGRCTEQTDDAAAERVCFRVRTQEGQELTLVHEPEAKTWLVRD